MIAFELVGAFSLFPLPFKLSISRLTCFLAFGLPIFSPAPLQGLGVSKQLYGCFAGGRGQPTTVLFGAQHGA